MPTIVDSSSPSFATAADVAQRLVRDFSDTETAAAEMLLIAATAAIVEAAGKDEAWADDLSPVPTVLWSLTVEIVARVMVNPEGASSVSEQLGSYQYTKGFRNAAQEAGIGLTPDEARRVRRWVSGTSFRSVTLETPYSGAVDADDDALPLGS